MKIDFQITGLPRSGTAFAATAFNYCNGVFCSHEPLELGVPFPPHGYRFVGETGTYQHLPGHIVESARKVCLVRDGNACRESAERMMKEPIPHWEAIVDSVVAYKQRPDVVCFPFEKLFTVQGLLELFDLCLGDYHVDNWKLNELIQMNVQKQGMRERVIAYQNRNSVS